MRGRAAAKGLGGTNAVRHRGKSPAVSMREVSGARGSGPGNPSGSAVIRRDNYRQLLSTGSLGRARSRGWAWAPPFPH